MTTKHLIKIEAPFSYYLTFEEEHTPASVTFGFEQCGTDHSEAIEAIENGDLLYFCAKVSIVYTGLEDFELGAAYLGACTAASEQAAIDSDLDGYLPQLLEDALTDARPMINIIEELPKTSAKL